MRRAPGRGFQGPPRSRLRRESAELVAASRRAPLWAGFLDSLSPGCRPGERFPFARLLLLESGDLPRGLLGRPLVRFHERLGAPSLLARLSWLVARGRLLELSRQADVRRSTSLSFSSALRPRCSVAPRLLLGGRGPRLCWGTFRVALAGCARSEVCFLGVDHVPVHERQPAFRETGFRLGVLSAFTVRSGPHLLEHGVMLRGKPFPGKVGRAGQPTEPGRSRRSARAIPPLLRTMSRGRVSRSECARPSEGGSVASRRSADLTRDRLPGVLLASLVVVVQLAWGGALVYLGFHFLSR